MIPAALTGFATGFSLILAIGAQNTFVLRQGLVRAHVFWLCLFCAASDATRKSNSARCIRRSNGEKSGNWCSSIDMDHENRSTFHTRFRHAAE